MKVPKEPMEVLKCHECQKSFSNKKTLGDHIRHTHNKEGNFWHLHNEFSLSMTLKIHVYKAMKTPESSRWSETLAQIVT